jgi:hypothetical protein
MWGYGGSIVMGEIDRKIYDYFKRRRLDVQDFAWQDDYAEEHNIPEEFQPFWPGQWYDCSSLGEAHGVSRDGGTIQIEDETGNTVFERSLDSIGEVDGDPEMECEDEVWIAQAGVGAVVFVGRSNEKGTFFEADIPLTKPFDPQLLTLTYTEIDGEEIVTSVMYDGEDIDNWGGSTDGKSSDFGFYLVKEGLDFESYRNMDDIKYELTNWFPKDVTPHRQGIYNIEPQDSGDAHYTYNALWTGDKWVSAYNEENEVDVKCWRGIAQDPDA